MESYATWHSGHKTRVLSQLLTSVATNPSNLHATYASSAFAKTCAICGNMAPQCQQVFPYRFSRCSLTLVPKLLTEPEPFFRGAVASLSLSDRLLLLAFPMLAGAEGTAKRLDWGPASVSRFRCGAFRSDGGGGGIVGRVAKAKDPRSGRIYDCSCCSGSGSRCRG